MLDCEKRFVVIFRTSIVVWTVGDLRNPLQGVYRIGCNPYPMRYGLQAWGTAPLSCVGWCEGEGRVSAMGEDAADGAGGWAVSSALDGHNPGGRGMWSAGSCPPTASDRLSTAPLAAKRNCHAAEGA